MRRSIQAVAWISIALSTTLSATTPASADESEPRNDDEWVVLAQQPPGSTLQVIQGERNSAGACQFRPQLTLAPGETAIRGDEVRRNTATCESEFAIRKDSAVPNDPGEPSSVRNESLATGPGVSDARAETSTAYVYSIGYMKTWWTDPLGIVVNSVENGVRWYWDNIDCVSPESVWREYGWYPGSGWELSDENWQRGYDCFAEVSSSYVHYRNWKFCAFIDTHAYYDRNTVWGKWDGYLTGQSDTEVSGGCSDLLSYHFELRRTLN